MLNFKKLMKSETGILLASMILGLGVAGLFKMSCDSRSCLVYKGPDFSKKKKIKVNNKCYDVQENIIECEKNNESNEIFL